MQKYSSNVIEKCLELYKESLPVFVNEMICTNRTLGNFIFKLKNFKKDLMKNNYGNFVVQKGLKLAKGTLKVFLIVAVLKNIDKMGDRKLILRWKNILSANLPEENELNLTEKEIITECIKIMENNFINVDNFNPFNIYVKIFFKFFNFIDVNTTKKGFILFW